MTKLIIKLPTQVATATTEFAYALSTDGVSVDRHASAVANLLPPNSGAGDEVIAMVPARALSWHQAQLPQGISMTSPRLRPVLVGLLEEYLLDDADNLHFALEPIKEPALPFWVAVCDKAWLRTCLSTLESAKCQVSRIVPELVPGQAQMTPTTIYLLGEPDMADLVVPDEGGITIMPLSVGAVSLARNLGNLPPDADLMADPAVVEMAEQHLQRRATLQTWDQRAIRAIETNWDLAQFDLANSGGKRAMKRLSTGWSDFLQSPQWRAARWGSLMLVFANLVGLNAWALHEKNALASKRQAIRSVLTQTFPAVQTVVDAPVQMEREVAVLRRGGGELSPRDLEVLLGAVSELTPINRTVSHIEFAAGEVRFQGLGLNGEEGSAITTGLSSHGLIGRVDGDILIVKPMDAR